MKKVINNLPDPERNRPFNFEDELARFCYHFPQYTYKQAETLPAKRVIRMLKAAEKESALLMLQLLDVVAAPHSKEGMENTRKKYQDIYNGKE